MFHISRYSISPLYHQSRASHMASFQRVLNITLNPWFAIVFCTLTTLSFFYVDRPLAYYCHDFDFKTHFPMLNIVTMLGLGSVYILLFLGLALFFRYVRRHRVWEKRCWFLWLCVVVPNAISLVLKVILGRARPELLFEQNLYGFYGFRSNSLFWSCPSGHTTTIMGLVFGLIVLFPKYAYAFLLAALVILMSRIALTAHFLSDIMATSYLVLLEASVLYVIYSRGYCQAFSSLGRLHDEQA